MQDSDSNPYQSTIDAKAPAKQPARWWKRILIANLLLLVTFGVTAIGGLFVLRIGAGSLTGVGLQGDWVTLLGDALLIAAIGFGLLNVFLILGKVILDRRNG